MTASPPNVGRASLIAVAARPVLPVANGYSLRVSNLLRELATKWRITLIAPTGEASEADLLSIGVARVVPMPLFRGWEFALDETERATVRSMVNEVLAAERPSAALVWAGAEIVLLDNPAFPSTVLDRLDCEVVIHWRQLRGVRSPLDKLRALRAGISWAGRERRLVRAAHATIVDGRLDRRVLQLVSGRSSIHCVTNGVEVQSPTPPTGRATTPTIVLTGSLAYSANVDAAVWFAREAWPRIRSALPASRFVLAGRDPSAEILALRSVPGIEILGNVPDMMPVLRDAWVAIAPVQTGSGIRTKVLEAWAVGTPVVLSPVAATGLALDADSSSLVASGAAQTTKVLLEVLQNPQLRDRLGASAHALATREYAGWLRPAQRVSDLLEQAARSR